MMFAEHASKAFNQNLKTVLHELADDVHIALGDNLVALILGGGYGRGEGGTIMREGQEQPYNDLDLFLVVNDAHLVDNTALDTVKHQYEVSLGIDVDFSRPLTIRHIQHWEPKLMWHDLVHGHHVLYGPPDILHKHTPTRVLEKPVLLEASRLLLNRGAGLLWARRIVESGVAPPDPDFVRRNYHKCMLAFGDALLMTHGQYTSAYKYRSSNYNRLANGSGDVGAFALGEKYDDALIFRKLPEFSPHQSITGEHLEQACELWGRVFLYIERLRTGREWQDLDSYISWSGLRETVEHSLRKLPRNIIGNIRMGMVSLRYPRELLYRRLPVLLGQTSLQMKPWNQQVDTFLNIWNRYN